MLTIGAVIADRYEIIGKIGAGGMSDVYKAKDYVLGRNVAIKVLKQEFSEDRNFVSKFRMEAQSAAGMEHPNIVNIYDVGNEEGMYYIVMEYVEGITLKTYIEKKGQLAFKESVSIAIQVARGIEAAHNKDIIHRDIKPQNIIISTEGKVKVTDFGIARAASANTISSDVMGSVHYSSPEQARNGFVDERSDIYSLGIVMFEMITGRVPFDGETTVAVAIQHIQDDMPKPSKYAPDLPHSFEQIILKCTQKSPDRRYQRVSDLLNDLRRSLSEPQGDFVVIAPPFDNARTKVLGADELREIREHSGIGTEQKNEDDEDIEILDDGKKTEASHAALEEEDEQIPDAAEIDGDDDDDEEDAGGINPKLDRAMTIMSVVTFVVIMILIVYFLGSVFGLFKFSTKRKNTENIAVTETESESETETESESESAKQVAMIDIHGDNYEEAEAKLKAIGLGFKISYYVDSTQEKDTIVTQSVAAGEMTDLGTVIEVTVSGNDSSSTEVSVPAVTGYNENNATTEIANVKLTFDKSYSYSDSVPAGTVISQSPGAGEKVAEGTTVHLTISQGKEAVTVPSVLGEDENSAKAKLTNAGLTYVTKTEYSDSVAEGQVISQSPSSDKKVEDGSTVTIVVSLGREPEPEVEEEQNHTSEAGTGTDTKTDSESGTGSITDSTDNTTGSSSDGTDTNAGTDSSTGKDSSSAAESADSSNGQ